MFVVECGCGDGGEIEYCGGIQREVTDELRQDWAVVVIIVESDANVSYCQLETVIHGLV